jgi:hypothetical protein
VSICSSSTRSSKPAIYGIAAEAEIKILRPLASIEVRLDLTTLPQPSGSTPVSNLITALLQISADCQSGITMFTHG